MAEPAPYSVVIVTFHHAATLPACLASVEALTPRPLRVVVVDNASNDGCAEIARSHAAAGALTLVEEPSNTGFAAAANRGIRATGTPWVLLLNPDCAPRPDMARHLLEAATHSPAPDRTGAVAPKLLRAEDPRLAAGDIVDAAGMVVTASGRHLDRGGGCRDDGRYDRPAEVFGAGAAAALYRREALDDVAYRGGEIFAESFFAYREDAELAWRLQLRGWSCRYEPAAVGAHRRGFRPEAGRRGHAVINRLSVRNRFLLRWHCADLGWHLRCLPWWLLRDLLVVAACLTVERSSLGALIELWKLRADARRRRRWVQDRRTVDSRRMAHWFRRRGGVQEVGTR